MAMDLHKCRECGWVCRAEPEGSIGTAHAHAERHAKGLFGLTRFWPVADPDVLDEYIKTVRVVVTRHV